MAEYGMSDTEYQIIKQQVARRLRLREEFLRKRTNPYRHAEAKGGYVFDEAMQRFNSMKVTQMYYFTANPRTIKLGILLYSPFFILGYFTYTERADREAKIRAGITRYKDRSFKLA